jgi:hypothetical protein
MIIALIAVVALVGIGAKWGPEDRPGFNERRPLA